MKRLRLWIIEWLVRLRLRKPVRFNKDGLPVDVMGRTSGCIQVSGEDVDKLGYAHITNYEEIKRGAFLPIPEPCLKHEEGAYTGMHIFNPDGSYAGETFNCKNCGQMILGEKTLPEGHPWIKRKEDNDDLDTD